MEADCLLADAVIVASGGPKAVIGMSKIKERRLKQLEVKCHPGDMVGAYVPFYFCPRSIMLYIIHMANHSELTYRGGQGPIIHLEANLGRVAAWANEQGRRWAFSLSNAGAGYAEFRADLSQLDQVNWDAVDALDFRDPEIQESKQAEFLVHETFPFSLVDAIGVSSTSVRKRVAELLRDSETQPPVAVKPGWYF